MDNSNYNAVVKELELCGITPLVKLENIRDTLPLMGALTSAGIKVVEIVFRSSIAKDAIKLIASKCQNMLVGAGTVISIEQVNEAISAGAKYIVTPSFNAKVVDRCIELGIPVFPGCSNATDIEQAYQRGLRVVKFFPSELLGGVNMLKALSGPYPFMRFMPTGGINSSNLNKYLSYKNVLCCGGTFMVNEELLKQGKFEEITKNARDAINDMLDIQLDHVGINTNELEGIKLLKTFSKLSGKNYIESQGKFSGIEAVMKDHFGRIGHVAFSSPNLERCLYYLADRGFAIDKNSIVHANGNIQKVNLAGDNAGFVIRLIRKDCSDNGN
ncbi:MAG: bifunctional 4-hydroxy-2-oxoglutarate aldolase/2-dehydro-3-deoxy-phosphogluconate aldolase [Clostridiales bacterium]|nr:bifunctional 4-hydroxy-2-oxoglutarate aldolase/2-dehydro-3-deoxy-phosphogluconate aldolase [Clostridiales bacterium]